MTRRKHKVRVLRTNPLGRPGDVIEVTGSTPHVDRWLTIGVIEYVDEEAGDEGQGDDESEGAGEAEPGASEVLDPHAG